MLTESGRDLSLSPDEGLVEGLLSEGWAVADNFISPRMVEELVREIEALDNQGLMHPARIGQGEEQQRLEERRGDRIYWLDGRGSPAVMKRYLHRMEELRSAINRELMMGLFELESHAAIYDSGSRYEKHLDCFQGDDSRLVTVVLYLNRHWSKQDGGLLRFYLDEADDSRYMDIEPLAGRLVTFLSDRFHHEVLPANSRRVSLTGWFRRRPV